MKFYFIIISLLILFNLTNAQIGDSTFSTAKPKQDQSQGVYQNSDTLKLAAPDSLAADTTAKKKTYDVDTVIYASSRDSLFFYVNKKKMDLYGGSDLKYKDTDLRSADIFVDFPTHLVDAKGVPNDSLPGKFKDTPVLTQGGESYNGETMLYNFKTTQGYITSASTKGEDSKYSGEKIKKVDRNTYFIKDGIYTTCTQTPPDYYFYSSEMKVIQKKEIIAKWIWLYIGGVPFPMPLPFGVFPLESGRRSGIITPAFGQDGTYGYYFSHFGYFWAINDYVDLNLTGDYYTRGSYGIYSRFRYNKRYDFSGSIDAGYKLLKVDDPIHGYSLSKNWSLSINHHENFTPTLRMDANLQFLSGKSYIQSTSTNLNEQLQNEIISNATLSKTWDESGNSLNLSYTRDQNLENGNISEVLPSLTFNVPQQYPFRRQGNYTDQKWYELIGYNYTGLFLNKRNKSNGQLDINGGIEHSFNASASPKIGYFNISPNFSYTEDWYNKQVELYSAGIKVDSSTDSVVTNIIHRLAAVRTFRLGLSASTKFYGMFQPNMFGISAIRHIVTPSISYNYTPDFSSPGWGYYSTYTDYKGNKIKYDKFGSEVFNGPSSGEQQSLSFSVGNEFDMKTAADPTDTTSKVNKIQLLNLTAGMSYNFAADSLRFSDLNFNYHTSVGDWLNFSGGSAFTLYDYNRDTSSIYKGYDINKFLINEGRGLLRLRNFNFSISTSLSGEKLKSAESSKDTNKVQSEAFMPNQNNYQGIYSNKEADFSIPWSLSLSYNYSYSQITPYSKSKSSNVSASLDFNLTPKWKISMTSSYDFIQKEFAAPQIRISRDLECWLMDFTWNPIGTFAGYYFEIRVKAPQLQDLKVEKRGEFYNGK